MSAFEGKVVVVTGASSGIGETVAVAMAAQGAKVFGLSRRQDAIDAARKRHASVRWVRADVGKSSEVDAAIAAITAETGRIDVIVNNAGVVTFGPIEQTTDEAMREMLEANVLGLAFVTRAALPALKASRGSVVNIGSAAGHKAAAGASIYAATKAAVESLTRSWALELAPAGVRVNAVAPGPTETPIFDKLPYSKEAVTQVKAQFTAQVPLGRMASTEEIARWVLHVADPSVTWMTGHVLAIDGGMSLT